MPLICRVLWSMMFLAMTPYAVAASQCEIRFDQVFSVVETAVRMHNFNDALPHRDSGVTDLYHSKLKQIMGYESATFGLSVRWQAARHILASANLFATLVSETNRTSSTNAGIAPSDEHLDGFINRLVEDFEGKGDNFVHLRNQSIGVFRLTLNGQRAPEFNFNSLLKPGNLGVVLEGANTGYWLAAANETFKKQLLDQGLSLSDGEINETDEKFLRSAAKYIYIKTRLSDRWKINGGDFFEDLESMIPGNALTGQPYSRPLIITFYTPEVASAWLPPEGVKLNSRLKRFITVALTNPEQIFDLDHDVRIKSFDWSESKPL